MNDFVKCLVFCVCVSEFVTHVSQSLLVVHCLALPLSHLKAAVSGFLLV